MERIKLAIENAKKPEAAQAGISGMSSAERKLPKPGKSHQGVRWDIVKNISGVVLIVFAGWLWMRLDFMNRLELIASEYINDGVRQARAEAKKRLEDEAKFRELIGANLAHCQEAAQRDNERYMKLAQKEVRVKNTKAVQDNQVKFHIPKAALREAENMLETAKAECRQIYETQLKNGR